MTQGFFSGNRIASSVDLVSNAVLLEGMDLGNAVSLLSKGRFSDEMMPSVLHEAAHWDTFGTPVGLALSACFLRAWRRTQVLSEANEYESAIDLTRYRVFHEILRPLSEGLALFCEFDLLPGSSPVTSTPTLLAGVMFGDPRSAEAEGKLLGDLALRNLMRARRHSLFQARKENLLCQDFETSGGGYMMGYHFVKNLRNYLVGRRMCVDLIDGDLFFYCVRAAIFGDLKLARLIVDPQLDFMFAGDTTAIEQDAINAVLKRLGELFEFIIHDLDNDYIKHVAEITTRKKWAWNDFCDPLTRKDIDSEDLSILGEVLNRLTNGGVPRSDEAKVAQVCKRFLDNRSLLCLATVPAQIKVNEHHRCLIGLHPMGTAGMAVPAVPEAEVCDSPGRYEIYFDRRVHPGKVLFSAVVDGKCVACGCSNANEKYDMSDFEMSRPSFAEISRLCAQMDADMEVLIGDYPTVRHFTDQIENFTTEFYLRYCTAFMRLIGDRQIHAENVNLLEICKDNLTFLSNYTLISLQSSSIFCNGDLEVVAKFMNIDAKNFISELRAYPKLTGIAFHEERGSMFFFSF